jgi:uncharacterized repeat protein (TIGR04138 family)
MVDSSHPIAKLLQEDRRYRFEAYALVFEALSFAHKELEMTTQPEAKAEEESEEGQPERHLSGQQLCEAIRQYALEQYGYMAQTVLKTWGVTSTSDFGEIVFNLIRIGQMRKTKADRREHFDNVYDFDTGFRQNFKITLPQD